MNASAKHMPTIENMKNQCTGIIYEELQFKIQYNYMIFNIYIYLKIRFIAD
jgi:hypothetical protein